MSYKKTEIANISLQYVEFPYDKNKSNCLKNGLCIIIYFEGNYKANYKACVNAKYVKNISLYIFSLFAVYPNPCKVSINNYENEKNYNLLYYPPSKLIKQFIYYWNNVLLSKQVTVVIDAFILDISYIE